MTTLTHPDTHYTTNGGLECREPLRHVQIIDMTQPAFLDMLLTRLEALEATFAEWRREHEGDGK
jgi:hypothetical protein